MKSLVSILDAYNTARLTSFFLGMAIMIATMEFISLSHQFQEDGIFSLIRYRESLLNKLLNKFLISPQIAVTFLCFRLYASMALLLFSVLPTHRLSLQVTPLCCALATEFYLRSRTSHAIEGSDWMTTTVTLGLLVTAVRPESCAWQLMGFGTIAAQACLSYFSSGVAKAASPIWRSGSAMKIILRSQGPSKHFLQRYYDKFPLLGLATCWLVILFEILFPASLLYTDLLLAFLLVGLLFHLANAAILGLNVFFWAFTASYPSMLYINHLLTLNMQSAK